MGGCCCSSRKPQLHGTPVYYYCPPALEEHESLTSHDSASVSLTAGLFIDLNLDASIPDTYRAPPAPIPFDVVLGCPHDSESVGETVSESSYQKTCNANLKQPDCKVQTGALLASPRKFEVEFSATKGPKVSTTEEEDVCPTCLEGVVVLHQNMMQRIQELPQNVTINFTFHAFLSGWKEVTPAPSAIRFASRCILSHQESVSCLFSDRVK
ncbi:hypothetical protein RJ640_006202 [Escallonia rubra]|uniref:Uncharacterized protein n=1 Tax=Escallonia rubra TaxID=112253 RepID=A0AA88QAW6_9ASTE|nr:hypothetical protein RJ640_006202 [Escallonia rubra]